MLLERAKSGLKLQPFWRVELGRVVLLGITSTLAALPVYEAEALPEERAEWRRLHEEHLVEISEAFAALRPEQRVLLFCHAPSALPFLWRQEKVRVKIGQVERTVIGHLHTNLVFELSRALRQARHWAPFKPLLCPSPAGSQLLKDGGYFTVKIDDTGTSPTIFKFHPLGWEELLP